MSTATAINHTAEPWYVLRDRDQRTGVTVHGGKKFDDQCDESPTIMRGVASVACDGNSRHAIAEANAVRAVACVNACEGLEDPRKFIQCAKAVARLLDGKDLGEMSKYVLERAIGDLRETMNLP